jgi:hypothetical protein
VVADGNAGVGTYAVQADGSLAEVGTVDLGESISSVDGSSGRFYAGGDQGILSVLRVTSSEAPTVIGSIDLGSPINDLVVQSRTVFCALDETGVGMVDAADPTSPQLLDTLDVGGRVLSVAQLGDLLYCGVEGIGLVTVSVENDSLSLAGSLTLQEAPVGLTAWQGRVYMATPGTGVTEADITLPGDPLLLAHLDLDGATQVALLGSTLFVTRGFSGFSSVDIGDCVGAGIEPVISYVPAAAKAEGGFNSDWVTDAAIANLTDTTASVSVSYIVKAQENLHPVSVSLLLQPGQQLFVEDVFATLFDLDAANGALRIIASHPDVRITTRTYNTAGTEGTYGQYIPALKSEAALSPGKVAALPQLQQNGNFRTNIGLMNLKLIPVEVEIQLYRGDGSLVGVVNETLEAGEMTQIDQIYTLVGGGGVNNGYALLRVHTDGGLLLSYASIADKHSNDAIFIGAQILTYDITFSGP